jgi:hypothetical protein
MALHPGEVSTDMGNITVDWEVEGQITPQESVRCMLKVIEEKGCDGKDEGGGWGLQQKGCHSKRVQQHFGLGKGTAILGESLKDRLKRQIACIQLPHVHKQCVVRILNPKSYTPLSI